MNAKVIENNWISGVEKIFDNLNFKNPAEVLSKIGEVAASAMGGTSGGVYSILLTSTSTKLSSASDLSKYSSWASAFQTGIEAVIKYGGADVGDRTLVI